MRKKKTEDEAALTPEASTSRQRLTPAEIQQAEFRLSMRGYNEREVDELLDRLTEDWGAVLEENKRLRDQSGPIAAAPPDTAVADAKREADAIVAKARQEAAEIVRNASQATPAAAPADAAEVAVVSSFLNKERDFLQSLGRLVQGHAESVKSMAQGAKAAESKPAARPAPIAQAASAQKAEPAPAPKSHAMPPSPAPKPAAPAPASGAPKPAEPGAPQTAGAPTQPVVKIDAGEEVPEPAPQAKAAEPQKAQSAPSPSAQSSAQPAPAKQSAPIRIPEGGAPERASASTPAPQGSDRRGDPAQNREEELSLRELFWGDE